MAHPSHLYTSLKIRIQKSVFFILSLHKCMEDIFCVTNGSCLIVATLSLLKR